MAINKSIALFNLLQATNYRLFSITGQSVLDGKITNNTYVIEANTLANGIYIIELQDAESNAVIRKKIVL
ncbi:MAG: T9SS type A sorting domain-containing protein [Bacteroidetes bacterium]|nr:T9SS type A sorting domain-containing protein [Bacteroidota bacterium]